MSFLIIVLAALPVVLLLAIFNDDYKEPILGLNPPESSCGICGGTGVVDIGGGESVECPCTYGSA